MDAQSIVNKSLQIAWAKINENKKEFCVIHLTCKRNQKHNNILTKFTCKGENTLKSMGFLTLWDSSLSLAVYKDNMAL